MSLGTQNNPLRWVVHLSVIALVALWLMPTLGLFISSFRTVDQISGSGWWKSPFSQQQSLQLRTDGPDAQEFIDGQYIISGNIFEGGEALKFDKWGTQSREPSAFTPDHEVILKTGETLTLSETGDYLLSSQSKIEGSRGKRIFIQATVPPEFTFDNYETMLFDPKNIEGMSKAFINTLTVTIPATIIPILVAAFAAYALAWMNFPGRAILVAVIVGLLVVPLQLALIPLLRLHLGIGIGKGYLGVWLAHTGFGLPMAIYLLRNYMAGLPRDIIENARVDGATEYEIFTRIILPLSFPALASFAIFQFLWTWNDLLVAKVFLIDATGNTTVMTTKIVEMLGTRGGNWEILATAAFVSIFVPLVVFFSLQRFLVRGLLAGSVK